MNSGKKEWYSSSHFIFVSSQSSRLENDVRNFSICVEAQTCVAISPGRSFHRFGLQKPRHTFLKVCQSPDFEATRLRLHEQIKHALVEQFQPELHHTNPKFEQIQATLFAHVNPAKIVKGPVGILLRRKGINVYVQGLIECWIWQYLQI